MEPLVNGQPGPHECWEEWAEHCLTHDDVASRMAESTVWRYGAEGGYHDDGCRCPDHCLHCFDDLPANREVRERLVRDLKIPARDRLHPRARYCSPYCRGRAKRDRRFDRDMALVTPRALT